MGNSEDASLVTLLTEDRLEISRGFGDGDIRSTFWKLCFGVFFGVSVKNKTKHLFKSLTFSLFPSIHSKAPNAEHFFCRTR